MAAALVENLQRQDLNALEEAEGYRRLLDEFGLTQDQLGQAVGKSRSHVANTLRLLALPDRVRELLRDGALTAGHARALLTAPDAESARAAGRGSRPECPSDRGACRRSKPRDPAAKPARAEPETAALERELSERLGLRSASGMPGVAGRSPSPIGTSTSWMGDPAAAAAS